MKVQCIWYVDGGFSLEEKLTLRKKLAEFPQVVLEESIGDTVCAWVPKEQLLLVVGGSITNIVPAGNNWIWITARANRAEVEAHKLAGIITTATKYPVYSFINKGKGEVQAAVYQELKENILTNQLPVFCLSEAGSLHDEKTKVVLDFFPPAVDKELVLKTENSRFALIMQKELVKDKKLAGKIKLAVNKEKSFILLKLSAESPAQLERAINTILSKAKSFNLTVIEK